MLVGGAQYGVFSETLATSKSLCESVLHVCHGAMHIYGSFLVFFSETLATSESLCEGV